LRLAGALLKQGADAAVVVFLLGDAVLCLAQGGSTGTFHARRYVSPVAGTPRRVHFVSGMPVGAAITFHVSAFASQTETTMFLSVRPRCGEASKS